MAVGEYCGCYVWVLPEGQDQLTKLTLAILDYALHEPPVKRTKQVDYNIDEYGLPTTSQRCRGQGDRPGGDRRARRGPAEDEQADEARIEQFLDYRHKHVKERLAATTNPEERKALLDEDQMLQKQAGLPARATADRRSGGAVLSRVPRSPPAPTFCNWTCIRTPCPTSGRRIDRLPGGRAVVIRTNLRRTVLRPPVSSLCLALPGKAGSSLSPSR